MNELIFITVFGIGSISGAMAVFAYFHSKPDLKYYKNPKKGKAGHMEADGYYIGRLRVKDVDRIGDEVLYFTQSQMLDARERAIREQNEKK